jgi:hypothetical protein
MWICFRISTQSTLHEATRPCYGADSESANFLGTIPRLAMSHQETPLFLLKAEREHLQAEASKLQQQLSSINTSLNQVNTKIARITNSTAPLYTLPNEIITAIIDAGLRTSRTFAILTSHITHHLREVAIGSPALWNRISARYSLDKVDTYLHRSGRCLLDIEVTLTRGYWSPLPPLGSQWLIILSHVSRWRSLSLSSEPTSITDTMALSEVFEHLGSVCAPRLERLRLSVGEYVLPLCLFRVVGDATIASEPFMHHNRLPLDSPLPSPTVVTSLELECAFASYDHLCHFLLTHPRLTDLTLWIRAWLPSGDDRVIASLSRLSTFKIINIPDDYNLCDLFARLVIPGLHCLDLSSASPSVLTRFANWLSVVSPAGTRYSALRLFKFGVTNLPTGSLTNLIYCLPDITNITISISKADEEEENTGPGNIALTLLYDVTAWPHLDTLTVDNFNERDEEFSVILCSIIAFRPSIRSLCLLHCVEFRDPPSPESSLESSPESSPKIIVEDTQSSVVAWLRTHVNLEYLSVCYCGDMWDHENCAWKHRCSTIY